MTKTLVKWCFLALIGTVLVFGLLHLLGVKSLIAATITLFVLIAVLSAPDKREMEKTAALGMAEAAVAVFIFRGLDILIIAEMGTRNLWISSILGLTALSMTLYVYFGLYKNLAKVATGPTAKEIAAGLLLVEFLVILSLITRIS